jgi:pyruvate,water dikinase
MTSIISMSSFVFHFQDIDKTSISLFGGKGANLGELTRIDGLHVPNGFCISTEAFKKIIDQSPPTKELLQQLSQLKP